MKIRLCLLCVITLASLSTVTLDAQNQVTASQTVQTTEAGADNPAVATVQKAIAAMGGEAWESAKAATVQSTVKARGGPSTTTVRNMDWSSDRLRYRKDIGNEGHASTEFESGPVRGIIQNGKVWMAPASYDLSTLAEFSPAAAMKLALDRGCNFRALGQPSAADKNLYNQIAMECAVAAYPRGIAHFLWRFDAAGMPQEIDVPLLSMDGRSEIHRTLRYGGYQRIQGLAIPSSVQFLQGDQLISTETFSHVDVQAKLPETSLTTDVQR